MTSNVAATYRHLIHTLAAESFADTMSRVELEDEFDAEYLYADDEALSLDEWLDAQPTDYDTLVEYTDGDTADYELPW